MQAWRLNIATYCVSSRGQNRGKNNCARGDHVRSIQSFVRIVSDGVDVGKVLSGEMSSELQNMPSAAPRIIRASFC